MNDSLLVELFTEELPPKALNKLGVSFASTLFEELVAAGFVAKNIVSLEGPLAKHRVAHTGIPLPPPPSAGKRDPRPRHQPRSCFEERPQRQRGPLRNCLSPFNGSPPSLPRGFPVAL